MKRIIILGDGMADEPIAALGGKTPLQAAHKPTIDTIARLGKNGVFSTVPEGFKPGSEIANMTVLGYDVRTEFEGRGSLEAASIGVAIQPCVATLSARKMEKSKTTRLATSATRKQKF